jgi:hypothetical protein
MKPSANYDRVVDVMEGLLRFTWLLRDRADYLVDRILAAKEAKAYENDQKCWTSYLSDPRKEAAHRLRTAGHRPAW